MMQLAFSTLGCPDWDFAEILTVAQRLGYAGVEFRGLQAHLELAQAAEFSPAHIAETRQRLHDAGVQATCLSSSVQMLSAMGAEIDRKQASLTTERYIEMAHELDAPFVRLFGGEPPLAMPLRETEERAAETLSALGDFAAARQVTVLLETHDFYTDTALLANLIHLTNHPHVRVLWDIHHPYRLAGESPLTSLQHLHGLVRYTHIKDSVMHAETGEYSYTPLGQGDVPLHEALRLLRQEGYDGFLTLEWEKRWHPELLPPEIAFPQYAEKMREWLRDL